MDFRIDDLLDELAQEWATQGRTSGDLSAFAAQRELAAARGLFAREAAAGASGTTTSKASADGPDLPCADALGKEILRLALIASLEHRSATGAGGADLGR